MPSISVHISLPKPSYVLGEALYLKLRITNHGTTPVLVPNPMHSSNAQPRYDIVGPHFKGTHRFSGRSCFLGDDSLVVDYLDAIAPDQDLDATFPLSQALEITLAGAYELSCELQIEEQTVRSNRIGFTLEDADVVGTCLHFRMGNKADRTVNLAWFHRSTKDHTLYRCGIPRLDPLGNRADRPSSTPVRTMARGSERPVYPWFHDSDQIGYHGWYAWIEDTKLVAYYLAHPKPLTVDLGAAPCSVVRPAWMEQDGTLRFFCIVSPDQLVQVSVPALDRDNIQVKPHVARWQLASRAVAGTCYMTPPDKGRQRRLLVVSQTGQGVDLCYLATGSQQPQVPRVVATIPGAMAIPECTPAFYVDPRGNNRASVLFEYLTEDTDDPQWNLGLAEVVFDEDGTCIETPDIVGLAPLKSRCDAATVCYQMGPDGRFYETRSWVALQHRGALLTCHRGGPVKVVVPTWHPVVPLECACYEESSYLLIKTATGPGVFLFGDV